MIEQLVGLFIGCVTATGFQSDICMPIVDDIVEEMVMEEMSIPRVIRHKGWSDDSYVQDFVNYAYGLGGLDFVKLIECENGRRDSTRVSKTNDHGLCQVNPKWHTLPGDWDDPYVQMLYCYDLWTGGTKFYGPSRLIHGQRCSDYVSSRFELL